MQQLYINNKEHYKDFVLLNEQWIKEYFTLETGDIELAENPGKVIDEGGYILSIADKNNVIGVCALFNQGEGCFELARLAVNKQHRRKGYGDRLIKESLAVLRDINASKVNLMSNTLLKDAIALYKKNGFNVISEETHPIYTRCNIMMEKTMPYGN